MQPIRPSRFARRGFSLIEAMLAIVVVVLAVLAMLSMVPFGHNSVQTNSVQVQAISIAQKYLDDERNALSQNTFAMPTATTAPIDGGQSFVGGSVSNYGNFTVTPDGCPTKQYSGSSANVFSCSVTVTWTEMGSTRTVTVQTYVTK